MSDPRRTIAIHTCNVCQRSIVCRKDCPAPRERRIVCAVCAGQNHIGKGD